jgi:hypothetical protein
VPNIAQLEEVLAEKITGGGFHKSQLDKPKDSNRCLTVNFPQWTNRTEKKRKHREIEKE